MYLRHLTISYEDAVTFDTDLVSDPPLTVGVGYYNLSVGYVTPRPNFIGNEETEFLLDYNAEDDVFILPSRFPSPYEATLSLTP